METLKARWIDALIPISIAASTVALVTVTEIVWLSSRASQKLSDSNVEVKADTTSDEEQCRVYYQYLYGFIRDGKPLPVPSSAATDCED